MKISEAKYRQLIEQNEQLKKENEKLKQKINQYGKTQYYRALNNLGLDSFESWTGLYQYPEKP